MHSIALVLKLPSFIKIWAAITPPPNSRRFDILLDRLRCSTFVKNNRYKPFEFFSQYLEKQVRKAKVNPLRNSDSLEEQNTASYRNYYCQILKFTFGRGFASRREKELCRPVESGQAMEFRRTGKFLNHWRSIKYIDVWICMDKASDI